MILPPSSRRALAEARATIPPLPPCPAETRATTPPPGRAARRTIWVATACGGQPVRFGAGEGATQEQAEENALEAYRKRYGICAERVDAKQVRV